MDANRKLCMLCRYPVDESRMHSQTPSSHRAPDAVTIKQHNITTAGRATIKYNFQPLNLTKGRQTAFYGGIASYSWLKHSFIWFSFNCPCSIRPHLAATFANSDEGHVAIWSDYTFDQRQRASRQFGPKGDAASSRREKHMHYLLSNYVLMFALSNRIASWGSRAGPYSDFGQWILMRHKYVPRQTHCRYAAP